MPRQARDIVLFEQHIQLGASQTGGFAGFLHLLFGEAHQILQIDSLGLSKGGFPERSKGWTLPEMKTEVSHWLLVAARRDSSL